MSRSLTVRGVQDRPYTRDACCLLVTGLDTTAVAIGLGVGGLPRERWLRVGLAFAAFEGLMPIVGLVIGQHLSGVFGHIAGYMAAVLLIGLGVLEIHEALSEEEGPVTARVGTHTRSILATGLSVSLDELAVGFSLGTLRVPLGPALLYIAVQAFALTFAGLAIGQRAGARLGERAELAAGVLLALLGVVLLVSEATGLRFV